MARKSWTGNHFLLDALKGAAVAELAAGAARLLVQTRRPRVPRKREQRLGQHADELAGPTLPSTSRFPPSTIEEVPREGSR